MKIINLTVLMYFAFFDLIQTRKNANNEFNHLQQA